MKVRVFEGVNMYDRHLKSIATLKRAFGGWASGMVRCPGGRWLRWGKSDRLSETGYPRGVPMSEEHPSASCHHFEYGLSAPPVSYASAHDELNS